MYPFIRVMHIVFGAIWVGFAVFAAWLLMPAANDLGPDAPKLAAALERRGFIVAFPVLAGVTILTGIYLYWRYTAGFNPDISRTGTGMAYGIGALAGILAAILGGALIGPSVRRAREFTAEAASSKDEGARKQHLAAAAVLGRRAEMVGRVVAALLLVAIVCMAVAVHV